MAGRAKIAIPVGDPAGIGPEISLKAALDPAVRAACHPLLDSDPETLRRHADACGIAADLHVVDDVADADCSRVNVLAVPQPAAPHLASGLPAAAAEGLQVSGPFGADTMFNMSGVDAFLVMLHDQGHIPAKVLAPNAIAALTIGTPVLFASVAHGSAHDIAGKGVASPAAIVEAI